MTVAVLLALTPFLPLALAVAMVPQRSRYAAARLLPVMPLPALGVALLAGPDEHMLLPGVLLGLDLGLDETRRPLLLAAAALWTAAAIYSRGYIPRDAAQHRYNAFFLISMGGNLGLIVALDVPGFYLFFSLMTLSSYLLVVFERTDKAYAAGRAYIVLSILGEAALLVGFARAVSGAGSFLVADIGPALAAGPGHEATLLLLFSGFAIKAGQFPLHVWLPLAHPAAPTPASAVLSGAMIKAGLLGMLLFLPLGAASLPVVGAILVGVGLVTAFYGVLCGVPQENPKTVLAYSSLSQMGVLVAALGVVQAEPAAAEAMIPAILVYAAHHGLAKGALFFSVGVVQKTRRGRGPALAIATISALAIAGAPASAGALAKLLLAQGIADVPHRPAIILADLLSWSAFATAALMLRFLWVLGRIAVPAAGHAGPLLWLPFLAIALLAQAVPWALVLRDALAPAGASVSAYALWEGTWPVALAVAFAGLAVLAVRSGRARPPRIAEGDWIALLPGQRISIATWGLAYRWTARLLRRRPLVPTGLASAVAAGMARLEGAAQQPGASAAMLVVVLAFLAIALAPAVLR